MKAVDLEKADVNIGSLVDAPHQSLLQRLKAHPYSCFASFTFVLWLVLIVVLITVLYNRGNN